LFIITPARTNIYTLSLHDALPIYPARFLTVKKWIGTFTRSFNNTGNGTDGGCTLQWNYADSAAITAHFEFDNPKPTIAQTWTIRSEEHTSELQSLAYLVCRLLLEK